MSYNEFSSAGLLDKQERKEVLNEFSSAGLLDKQERKEVLCIK